MTNQPFSDLTNEDMDRLRTDFMADTTPVATADIPALVKIAEMLNNEDTDLNVYELYKHPDTRAKLFAQITEACFMVSSDHPTVKLSQEQKQVLIEYFEHQFQKIVKKLVTSTDKQTLGQLLDILELPEETENQFIKDMAIGGLLSTE